jgi:crotonobetainyl-CoA:carnitine CoA-transferase CaiB-like acyl-CoA transferase
VRSIAEAHASPQACAREMSVSLGEHDGRERRVIGTPGELSRTPPGGCAASTRSVVALDARSGERRWHWGSLVAVDLARGAIAWSESTGVG